MERVKASAFRWTMDAAGDWLCIQTGKARKILDELKAGKDYDVEIKEHREKRSLNANSYCWVLLGKLADKLFPVTKNEIYREYVRQIGPYKDFELTEGEAKTFRVVWENMGEGWPTEQVDFTPDGERVVIRAYYGSSTYNSKQMSRLIDLIVQDCREQGIETMPPDKLAGMMEEWGCTR